MTFSSLLAAAFHVDAFFWLVLPIAMVEGARVARTEALLRKRSGVAAAAYGLVEVALLVACGAARSPLSFVAVTVVRLGTQAARERGFFPRELTKIGLVVAAMLVLSLVGHAESFADLSASAAAMDSRWRSVIIVLVAAACVLGIVPVRVSDEARVTLTAPMVLIAFARVGAPLAEAQPDLALLAPVVGAVAGLLCALWLLSAGMRANHFEHASLVSELLVCERGVLLSFVWIGLASGQRLAGVGALLEWWTAALALLALDGALRVRDLPKPMAFFALAMAVGLPGTIGFVSGDLLAHGLLETQPWMAAAFVGISAINAAALYLALVNLIVDSGHRHHAESRPTFLMLLPAALSLVIGLGPAFFVTTASEAHSAVVRVASPHGALAAHDE